MPRSTRVPAVQRQLLILHVLHGGGERRRCRAADVRERVEEICYRNGSRLPAYSQRPGSYSESDRKAWQRDLHALRTKGLVTTGLRNPQTGQHDMLMASDLTKPRHCWLTREEHLALRDARALHAQSGLRPTFDPKKDGELDLAFRLMRTIEESLGPVSVGDVMAELGLRASDIQHLLAILDVVYNGGSESRLDLEQLADENAFTVAGLPVIHRGSKSPMRRWGMDEIGCFAYTRAECSDRITVINWALAQAGLGDNDRRLLTSARNKLEDWQRHLEG